MGRSYLSLLIAVFVISGMSETAHSALVTKTFIGTAANGQLAGDIGTGSFTYDEDLLLSGEEVIDPAGGLKVSFSFDAQLFDQTHDADFNVFPILAFEQFSPVELSYNLVDGVNGVDFNNSSIAELIIIGLSASGGNYDFTTDIFVAYTPIPGAFWLLGAGMAGLFAIKSRYRANRV